MEPPVNHSFIGVLVMSGKKKQNSPPRQAQSARSCFVTHAMPDFLELRVRGATGTVKAGARRSVAVDMVRQDGDFEWWKMLNNMVENMFF